MKGGCNEISAYEFGGCENEPQGSLLNLFLDSAGGIIGLPDSKANYVLMCSPSQFKVFCKERKIKRKNFFRMGNVRVVKMKPMKLKAE